MTRSNVRALRWGFGVAMLALSGCPKTLTPGDSGPGSGAAFHAPQGVAAHERWILVANTAFHFDAAGKTAFGEGFVTVIDRRRRQVVARVPTTQRNPQRIAVVGDRAYVVNSGVVALHKDGPATVAEAGGIDVLELGGSEPPQRVLANLPLPRSALDARIGAYGAIALSKDGKTAFLGSGTRGDVFEIDLETMTLLHGPSDPIAVFATPSDRNDVTTVRRLGDELIVLSLSGDQLCRAPALRGGLAQRRCFGVGVDEKLIEGPIDIAATKEGAWLVAMTLANRLYRLDVASSDVAVQDRWMQTGGLDPLAPNRVHVHGAHAYLLASSSQQLLRVALTDGRAEGRFTVFPAGANPFDFVITEDPAGALAWVTLWGSHQLAVVDLASGQLLQTLGPRASIADGGVDGPPSDAPVRDAGPADLLSCDGSAAEIVGISNVVSVTYGAGAGHGQADLPQVIQGGPQGEPGGSVASVLSLGVGGELIVDFGDRRIVDGPGADFIVYENPFAQGPYQSYAEPAIVGVSEDGVTFVDFPCDLKRVVGDPAQELWAFPGCAGVRPVLANPARNCLSPEDPLQAGGDAFDLAALGLKTARYLRLRDAGISLLGDVSKGFDLDAVVLRHHAPLSTP